MEELVLNPDEVAMVDRIKRSGLGFKIEIEDDTDFFGAGAGLWMLWRLIRRGKRRGWAEPYQ